MGEARPQITSGQRDQRTAEMRAVRDVALFAVALGGVVLVNAVLGLFLIEVFGSLEARPTANPEGAAVLPVRLGLRFASSSAVDRGFRPAASFPGYRPAL